MAIAQRGLKQATRSARPLRRPGTLALRPFQAVIRLLGRMESGGPRGYRREEFPEHEFYRMMAGRLDRFDGYR